MKTILKHTTETAHETRRRLLMSRVSDSSQITVFLQDELVRKAMPVLDDTNILHEPDLRIAERAKNLFIFACATKLSQVEQLVQVANYHHHLRALFVREDIDADWLPQMLYQANVRSLRNMIIHSGFEVPNRIIKAWQISAQNQLIANAVYNSDRLLVINCALERFELPFSSIAALDGIPLKDRGSFEIASDGSHINWPKADVDIDIDSIRSVVDKAWKERSEAIKFMHDKRYGKAIAVLRKKYKLRQSDIPEISERQVRRIENGERASLESLKHLAKAHGMQLSEYLDALASVISEIGGMPDDIQLISFRGNNPKVAGSNPAPATK